MSIIVVCQACRTSFKVNEKFAGKKGPCPKCKETITIPALDQQVQVHDSVHSEASARGAGGQLVLEPVGRDKVEFTPLLVGGIVGSVAGVFLAAYILGYLFQDEANDAMRAIVATCGTIVISPILVIAGYTFMRDSELAPYRGTSLWIRASICAAVYAAGWLAFSYVPTEWKVELWMWTFLAPPFLVAGATAAFASLDLTVSNATLHYCFYIVVSAALAYTMGISVLGTS